MELIKENPKTLRTSGSVGFDFMNTKYNHNGWIEILEDTNGLLYWMAGANLLSSNDIKTIRNKFSTADQSRLLADALALRDRLRAFTAAFKTKGVEGLPKDDLQYLNNILRRGNSYPKAIIQGGNQLSLQQTHEWNNIEEVLALIIEPVIRTLTTEEGKLIKRCANHVCDLWFVDETKARNRQWCSRAICGNRAKQAAFKARKKNK